jgi:hypothetical protein
MDWAKFIADRAPTSGVLRVDELARELKISEVAVRNALARQQRRGLVESVGNKIFMNRLTPNFSGRELINVFRPDAYLSLETVLRETGITTQTPLALTCVTSGRRGAFRAPSLQLTYRRIAPHLFWGFHSKRTRYGSYNIAEPEKALLDWIYLLRQEGSIVPTDELDLHPLEFQKVLQYAEKFPRPVRQEVLELVARSKAFGKR